MKSQLPKVLHKIAGLPLLGHVVAALRGAGVERIVVVTSPSGEAVRAYAASLGCESVVQDRQLGTGHAAGAAQSALGNFDGTLVIVNGDMPLVHLPTGFHAGAHSGRLLKVMIEGASGQMAIFQSFFREHCVGFIGLTILLPLTLFINLRLGAMLLGLVVAFGLMMNFVLRRTQGLQGSVDRLHSDLAERVSDVFGNVPAVQSFTRMQEETRALRSLIDSVLGAQLPVLSWWAVAAVATRASATLTLLAIFVTGIWLNIEGLATIGEIVTFMSLATTLIGRLEQNVAFVNMIVTLAPKLAQFFRSARYALGCRGSTGRSRGRPARRQSRL